MSTCESKYNGGRCERETGHPGNHLNGGASWEQESADDFFKDKRVRGLTLADEAVSRQIERVIKELVQLRRRRVELEEELEGLKWAEEAVQRDWDRRLGRADG